MDYHQRAREYKKGTCFDLQNLGTDEDVQFYLISDRDNILIQFEDVILCYTRKEIKNEMIPLTINGSEYYTFGDNSPLKNFMITKWGHNYLLNRSYNIYMLETNLVSHGFKWSTVVSYNSWKL